MASKSLEEIRKLKPEERTIEEQATLDAAERENRSQEHMIPKSRLDEVLETNRKLKEALEKSEQDRKDRETAALQEQGKWKEIAEQREKELKDAQQKATQVDTYEKALSRTLDAQLAEIPEDLRKLVPSALSTTQKLEWLSENKAILLKPNAFDIGAGAGSGGTQNRPRKKVELTEAQQTIARNFGLTAEEYAKFAEGGPEAFVAKQEAEDKS